MIVSHLHAVVLEFSKAWYAYDSRAKGATSQNMGSMTFSVMTCINVRLDKPQM